MIGIRKEDRKLHIASSINGIMSKHHSPVHLIVDQTYQVEVHQRYMSQGNYNYFIKIDGLEVYRIVNSDARQFWNVNVFAGNPWSEACPVYVKNFVITNFV